MTIGQYLDLKSLITSAILATIPPSVLLHQILGEINVIHHLCQLINGVVPALHTQTLKHELLVVLRLEGLIQQAEAKVPRV